MIKKNRRLLMGLAIVLIIWAVAHVVSTLERSHYPVSIAVKQ